MDARSVRKRFSEWTDIVRRTGRWIVSHSVVTTIETWRSIKQSRFDFELSAVVRFMFREAIKQVALRFLMD
jgi:hypothetical protein